MRSILNISLPATMVEDLKKQMKQERFATISEFIRHVIRKYNEERVYRILKKSEAEFRAGKGKILHSLKELD